MTKEKDLWMIKMIKRLNKFLKKILRKNWLKIERKHQNEWSWTEYTDYNGKTFIIYNLIPEPGFGDAYLKKK
jgi:hypothetical protein